MDKTLARFVRSQGGVAVKCVDPLSPWAGKVGAQVGVANGGLHLTVRFPCEVSSYAYSERYFAPWQVERVKS